MTASTTAVTLTGLTDGTYALTLYAVNAAGVASPPATTTLTIGRACQTGQTCGAPAFTAITAPLPPSRYFRDVVDIGYTSCGSTGLCGAAGVHFDSADHIQGMLEVLTNGRWTVTQAPLPPDAAADPNVHLTGISCTSSSTCVAVGYYNDSTNKAAGLINTYARGRWTALRAPLPADASDTTPGTRLSSVACPTSGYCVAVGRYSDVNGLGRDLAETYTGGAWTPATPPTPPTTNTQPGAWLTRVACPTSSWCGTIGYYHDDAGLQTQYAKINGAAWTTTKAATPSDAAANPAAAPGDFDCPQPGFCAGTGSYYDTNGNNKAFLAATVNGTLTLTAAPAPPDAWSTPSVWFSSVSCAAAKDCRAVGTYNNSQDAGTVFVEQLTGATWTALAIPVLGAASYGSRLDGISCTSSTACVAVGSYTTRQPDTGFGLGHPLIETMTGSTWQPTNGPIPAGVYNYGSHLNDISCTTATSCAAVGSYATPTGDPVALLETS